MGVSVEVSFISNIAELGGLFFRSFLLSQGDPDAQQHLFFAIALAHPEWLLGNDLVEHLKRTLPSQFVRYLSSGWHNPLFKLDEPDGEADMLAEMSEQLFALVEALRRGCPMPRERLLELLLEDVIDNDYKYLVLRGGRARPGRVAPMPFSSMHSPFFSHFCHFGLLGRSTGAPLYDQIFSELGIAYTQRSPLFWEVMKRGVCALRLELVLRCHNRAYLHQQIVTPGFSLRKQVRDR
jgi:hypothetical protein